MNSRSISPFLVSLALVVSMTSSDRVWAVEGNDLPASPMQAASVASVPVGSETKAVVAAVPEASYTLNQEQLLALVRDQISTHFNLEGELHIDLLRPWVTPAPAREPIVVTIVEFPTQMSSSILLHIKAESAGSTLYDANLSLRAQLWRDALVTRETVKRDEIFDPANLDTRRVDALRERDILPASNGDRNYSYNRGVPAGRLLNWRDISRRALVRKGDMVDVAAVEGLISITMKAIAMQSGASGDMISVRNPQTKKDISAQVVAENRVQVRF